jgi:hypothetical protein
MITLLADSNVLQDPRLDQFLAASRNHCIGLSDWTLIEMRKKEALGTSRDSLKWAFKYPSQCFALKRTDLLLDDRVRSRDDAARLIDYQASLELRGLARSLWQIPQPDELAAFMEHMEDEAVELLARLSVEVAGWEEEMIEAVSVFNQHEIRMLRRARTETIPHSTMSKVFDLLLHTTRDFMIRNQQRDGTEPVKVADAMAMFGFRYSLCVLLYTLGWVRTGSQKGRKVEQRVRDVIDLQVATVGTFFDGVLSLDKDLQEVSRGARHLLRLWGAYVGDDWVPQG